MPSIHPSRRTLQNVGLVAGPVLAAITWWALPEAYRPLTGNAMLLSASGRATMALMAWMATWWLTEAIDIEATALLPLVALPLAGVTTFRDAAVPYGDEFIFLFMGGFILALSMQRWGLDRRIALTTLRIVGSGPRAMVLGFMLATALLSGFVSNTATAAMMMPVGLSVIDLVVKRAGGANEPATSEDTLARRNFALCLMLGIAYAASIGGVGTIIGTPPNVLLVSFLRDGIHPQHRTDISFAGWLVVGVPLVAIMLPLTWLLLTRVLYPIRLTSIEGGSAFVREQVRVLGAPNAGERITLVVFMLAAIAWMVRPILARGWKAAHDGPATRPEDYLVPPLAPGLTDAGIAMIAALLLFVLPVRRAPFAFAMDWEHARRLPWGILILFGGGLSLASAIQAHGVAEYIGAHMRHFAGMPEIALVIIVVTAVVFFSEVASNTATAATLIPILAAMAPGLGVHPSMLVIPAAMAASLAFMMPVGTPPNAIVFGTGYVTMPQMVRAGFWLNIAGIISITLITMLIVKPRFAA